MPCPGECSATAFSVLFDCFPRVRSLLRKHFSILQSGVRLPNLYGRNNSNITAGEKSVLCRFSPRKSILNRRQSKLHTPTRSRIKIRSTRLTRSLCDAPQYTVHCALTNSRFFLPSTLFQSFSANFE